MAPMMCACGKVGLYRVGGQGFCRAHKQDAINRRKAWALKYKEPKMQAAEDFANLRDRMLRRRQHASRYVNVIGVHQ